MTADAGKHPVTSGALPALATPDAERKRGYGRWEGTRSARLWRWWVIARGNLALSWGNKWVKGALLASLVPGVIGAGVTYFFLPLSATVLDRVMDATVLFVFLVGALVGARLVSEDRKQGAFLAHFSRPVTRMDYVAGKFVAMMIPLLFVTMASPLFTIAADAAVDSTTFADRLSGFPISDEQGYLRATNYSGALGAVLAFGFIVSAATSGIVLGLSSLTTRTRIAGLIWFAFVAFGVAAHNILRESLEADWPALISWSDNVTDLSSFLVGFTSDANLGRQLEFDLATRVAVLLLAGLAGLGVVVFQLQRAEAGAR